RPSSTSATTAASLRIRSAPAAGASSPPSSRPPASTWTTCPIRRVTRASSPRGSRRCPRWTPASARCAPSARRRSRRAGASSCRCSPTARGPRSNGAARARPRFRSTGTSAADDRWRCSRTSTRGPPCCRRRSASRHRPGGSARSRPTRARPRWAASPCPSMPTAELPLPGANGVAPLLATYRLQLNREFDFDAALGLLPYLATLGVSHVYCSPILAAQPGSTHGYDVVDPARVDPALGGEAGFERLAEAAHAAGLGIMVDIVPNHMGIAGPANDWWDDVLRQGPASPHAPVFDIDWDADPGRRLRLPILGASVDEAREAGHFELRRNPGGDWRLRYHEHDLPVAPAGIEALERHAGSTAREGVLREAGALEALLEAQHYRLLHWTEAARSINYRRFFEVSTLAGIRAEDPEVFEATHGCILSLVERGLVDALRIDHPDGLRDPASYFHRLQAAIAERRPEAAPFYIAAEKILAPGESLPPDWPIAGTTGYDFANEVAGLMVDGDQVPALDAAWREFTGDTAATFADVARAARREVLLDAFGSELRRLVGLALAAGAGEEPGVWPALVELIAAFPVYRSYRVPDEPPGEADRQAIEHACRVARAQLEAHGGEQREQALASLDSLAAALLGTPAHAAGWEFIARFQQLTAPVAAKGVEDTAIYRFPRIASVNGVGGDPDLVGLSVDRFHQACARRLAEWPDAMLATSTHDNKRSEDVTMRIVALSEAPGSWSAIATAWRDAMRLAADPPRDDAGPLPPVNPGDLYLLMQTALGAWPIPRPASSEAPPAGSA